MTDQLPDFPLSDFVLDQLEHALNTSYGEDEELVGGEFTLDQLLDFYSGFDESKMYLVEERADIPSLGLEGVEVWGYDGKTYSERDVIRALINEVRALRKRVEGENDQEL